MYKKKENKMIQFKHKRGIGIMILSLALVFTLSACGKQEEKNKVENFTSWEDVVSEGSNKEVSILMWGGNESVNQYMDQYVAQKVKEMYGITLIRVPMNAPDFLTKLINEKKGNVENGTADLLWINAENFLTAKSAGLLSGPFTNLLPNLQTYYDSQASDLSYDSGIEIEGYEAIWGRAQLVFTYDEANLANPPKSYKELLDWVKANPGKFTYPKLPDDFAGAAFVRNAFYELTGEFDAFQEDMTQEEFEKLAEPVVAYFKELAPYLWNEGKSYPATQAQLDELFKNGEISLTMGFEVGKTAGLVASNVYADTVKTFIFDTGTIGNSHYLAIPFNSTEQAAALLVIDFLQSPEAQTEKLKSDVWGDMPAYDVSKLTQEQQDVVNSVEESSGTLSVQELTDHRLPEMKAVYIEWIKNLWVEEIAGK
jgi:putative spermidine/putrescine transport system substrate-binding protein